MSKRKQQSGRGAQPPQSQEEMQREAFEQSGTAPSQEEQQRKASEAVGQISADNPEGQGSGSTNDQPHDGGGNLEGTASADQGGNPPAEPQAGAPDGDGADGAAGGDAGAAAALVGTVTGGGDANANAQPPADETGETQGAGGTGAAEGGSGGVPASQVSADGTAPAAGGENASGAPGPVAGQQSSDATNADPSADGSVDPTYESGTFDGPDHCAVCGKELTGDDVHLDDSGEAFCQEHYEEGARDQAEEDEHDRLMKEQEEEFQRELGEVTPNVLAAALAASMAFGTDIKSGRVDQSWLRPTEGNSPSLIKRANVAAEFCRSNPDAPSAALPIHLRTKGGFKDIADLDPRHAAAWKVFRATLSALDDCDRQEQEAADRREAEQRNAQPVVDAGRAARVPDAGGIDAPGRQLA